MSGIEKECRDWLDKLELARVRESELLAKSNEAERSVSEFKDQLAVASKEMTELRTQVESLQKELESKTNLVQEQAEVAAKQMAKESEIVQRLAALEDKHTFLLDMTKEKDAKLS